MPKINLIILSFIAAVCLSSISLAATVQDGLSYYSTGNYSKAEKIFRNVLYTNSNDYTAKYMLAATLVNLQNYNEAKQLYRSVAANSNSQKLVSLSRTGLANLGEKATYRKQSRTKAVLNVNAQGSGIIINDVLLNNKAKTKFILDTGATYTTISKQMAAKLNISTKNAKIIKVATANGYTNAPFVKISVVEVNGLFVKNVDAIVLDLPGDKGIITGLLGLSFLEHFKVTIDRANSKVTLEKN